MTAFFDRSTQDVGNIVDFGHVNVRVPDQQQAILFYVMGLGLTRDPYLVTGVDNAWINVGSCQFHLPVGPEQVLRGTVGLVMPDLDALKMRLVRIAPRLRGTRFAFTEGDAVPGSRIDVTCPWGNRIRVHAPDAARFGRLRLGMPYVEIDAAPGTAKAIGRFYGQILGAPPTAAGAGTNGTESTESTESMKRKTAADRDGTEGAGVCVPTGLDTQLVFRETDRELPPYDGHHVQVTVADFSGVHRRLLELGLVTEESNESQYRFRDLIDPAGPAHGRVVATLEHEVRSMRHPMYGRRLVNRNPVVSNSAYAEGHEAAPWRLPPAR